MSTLVSAFFNSGQSQKEFAEAHGLTKGKLHYWVKKFSEARTTEPKVTSSFIPLEVSASEPPLSRTILIRMPNGLEIQIPI